MRKRRIEYVLRALSALVVGSDGLIARTLVAELARSGWHYIGTSRRETIPVGWVRFDLQDGGSALPEDALRTANVVFICAAVTGFAPCANDPEGSSQINVACTVELGRFFMARGLRVVYLSSNAVFDGMLPELDERAATAPVTEYGRQKANCEVGLLSAAAELEGSCAVVRLTKVVDPTQPLYSGWMENFKAQIPAKAAADVTVCPVTATYVARGLRRIGAGEQSGVYHLSGERDITYYELATAMATMVGVHASVEQDFLQQRLYAVPFPKYSAISMRQTIRTWDLEPQSMAAVVRELIGGNA